MGKGDLALLLSHEPEPVLHSTFKHIVLLGDSYSATLDTWIGHLLDKYPEEDRPALHNFAQPGDTAQEDLETQVQQLFAKYPSAASLEGDVLVVLWFGINDCGQTDAEDLSSIVEQVFEEMHDLYVKWKARSLLLIDVPPMHRSPGGLDLGIDAERYATWNDELLDQAGSFAESTSNASIFVVSSFKIISDFLDHPEAYSLSDSLEPWNEVDEDDDEDGEKLSADRKCGELKPMWEDDIHLSAAGHQAFADRLWGILGLHLRRA